MPSTLDDAGFDRLLGLAGLADEGGLVLPERMAPVNALLDAAPAALREQLVTAFVDRLCPAAATAVRDLHHLIQNVNRQTAIRTRL